MNANELADEAEKQSGLIYLVTEKQVAQQLEQMLKNYATMLRQQQAEIEALKAIINEAFKSIPAMGEDGEFYHEHHGMDGEYLGYENIPANYVVQVIEAILRKAQE